MKLLLKGWDGTQSIQRGYFLSPERQERYWEWEKDGRREQFREVELIAWLMDREGPKSKIKAAPSFHFFPRHHFTISFTLPY